MERSTFRPWPGHRFGHWVAIAAALSSLTLSLAGCQGPAEEPVTAPEAPGEVTTSSPETSVAAPAPAPAPEAVGPRFFTDQTRYDYGEIKPNTENAAFFEFSNTGDAELRIERVQGCCGARTKLSREVVPPGESAKLSVVYRTGSPGPFKKYLYLFTNDSEAPRVRLTVEGQIVRTMETDPRKLRLFLNRPNAGCRPVTIKALDGVPFRVTSYLCTSDMIRFDVDPNRSALSHELHPTVDMDALRSMKSPHGRIEFKLDRPDYQEATIYFDVVPNYVVNPPQIFLFNLDPARPEVRKVSVLDNYYEANGNQVSFKIASVEVEGKTAKLLQQDAVAEGVQLSFEIQAPAPKAGQSSFNDRVAIHLEGGQTLYVAIRGFYAQAVLLRAARGDPNRP